jgi:hypothetical protein
MREATEPAANGGHHIWRPVRRGVRKRTFWRLQISARIAENHVAASIDACVKEG